MADAVANVFLETLRDLVVEETKFLLGVGADVEKVKRDLESIHALLMKADRERHDSPTLEPYISQLKKLAEKAENLLETYAFEVESKREEGRRCLKDRFKRYICIICECSSVHQVGKEACDIIPALDKLTKELKSELDQQGSSSHSKQEAKRLLRLTLSHDVEHDFVGMEKDIQLLVSKVKDETRRKRVVKIYGMGGLGKTTLARKVYNHTDLQSYARAWVCITQQFEHKAVFGKILKDLDKHTNVDGLEIEDLMTRIHSLLEVKRKCLVVIDDIWEDVHWEIIRHAFPVNCDVILTTRSEDIANQQSEPYKLEFLKKDDGWTLLQKVADISPEDPHLKSFEDIGRKIVLKCEGLPLSICVIGGILRNKVQIEWIEVNQNMESHLKHGKGVEEYRRVKQVLELSYDALPYYLKPCFLYLACFPEDHKIDTEKLYLLWMAEGFISYQDKEANETLRDVAQRYLIELGMRCMVQLHDEANTYTPLKKFVSCGLHDLMHDLCSSKAKKEQFLMRIDASKYLTDIHLPTRIAISHIPYRESSIDGLKEVRGLRSFIVLQKHYYPEPTMGFKESMVNFKMSQYLRIFVVEGCEFEGGKLPSKVGELIHLRYLSLMCSNVRELPKSICSLPYLQTLDLRVSPVIKLSNVIWKMKRLKHLFLYTEIEVIGGEKLKLGGLQELETLDEISSETTCIADIPTLISLQKMRVEVHDVDGLSIVLNNINSQLRVSYLTVHSCDFSSENGREALNHGLMSPSLVSLMMWRCTMSSSFPYYKPEMCQNLVTLYLRKCKVKVDVKDFGKYPMLQELCLDEVEIEETLTCHSDSFPRLQTLQLWNLHDLKEWEVEEGAMPKLTSFVISECPNLEKVQNGLRFISTLRHIYICNMPRVFMERVNEEDYGPFVKKHINMEDIYEE